MNHATRTVVSLFAFVLLFAGAPGPAFAQDKPTLNKTGWIDDAKLREAAPPTKVIVSEAALYRTADTGTQLVFKILTASRYLRP